MNSRMAQKVSRRTLCDVWLIPVTSILGRETTPSASEPQALERPLPSRCARLQSLFRWVAPLQGVRLPEEMVLDHVPQAAGGFVKCAALPHTEILRQL